MTNVSAVKLPASLSLYHGMRADNNVGWFGLVEPVKSSVPGAVDELRPRQVFHSLQGLWAPYNRTWLFFTVGTLLGGVAIVVAVAIVSKRKHGDVPSKADERAPLLGSVQQSGLEKKRSR